MTRVAATSILTAMEQADVVDRYLTLAEQIDRSRLAMERERRAAARIERYIHAAVRQLQNDDRLLGLALGGSGARGCADAFSNLDLVVVARDECYEAVMQNRVAIARSLGPLLTAYTGSYVGESELLSCVYGPSLIHVDLWFVTLTTLDRNQEMRVLFERDQALSDCIRSHTPETPAVNHQWIEDRFWAWVHYGATRAARGELFETLDMLAMLRSLVLGPMILASAGQRPFGVRRVESTPLAQALGLERTVASTDRRSCFAALRDVVRIYRLLREEAQQPLRRNEALERYVNAALFELQDEFA